MPPPDPANLAPWYAAHAGPLTLYARQFTPDRAAAEDAVHEAFVNLLAQPRTPANVKAWLYTTVRNAALMHRRSSKRRSDRERTLTATRPDWFTPRPDDPLDAADAQAALATLPPDQRELIVLRIWAQATFADISAITGLPLSTLHDRYRTALSTLKQKLESHPCTKTP